jgi:hypothetical protein
MSDGTDRGFIGGLVKALGVPGGLTREAGLQLLEGDLELEKFGEILTGEDETSSGDMFDRLEDIAGLEPGTLEPDSEGLKMIRDFIGDVATSALPDKALSYPLKLARANNLLKGIQNPLAKKAAESAITGGTLGLLSADENDSTLDVLAKIGAGMGAAAGARGAVSGLAPAIGKNILSPILDNTVAKRYKNLDKIAKGMRFTDAFGIDKGTKGLVRSKSRLYHEEVGKVRENLMNQLNLGSSQEEVAEQMKVFDELLGDGFSKTVAVRNSASGFFNAVKKGDDAVANKTIEKLYEAIEPTLGEEGSMKALRGLYESIDAVKFTGDTAVDGFAKQRVATKFANEVANVHTMAKANDNPEIAKAIQKHAEANERLVEDFNAFNKSTKFDNSITPLRFHTVDLKNVEDYAQEDLLSAAKGGLQRRFSEEVKAVAEGLTPDQIQDIGAERFARLYLTNKELKARTILNQVSKNVAESKDIPERIMKGFDDLTQMMKTVHLTLGLSWIRNNFSGNMVNSVLSTGNTWLGGLAKMGTSSTKALGGIGQSLLKSAGDAVDSNILKDMAEKGTAGKMMRAMDGNGKKLNFKDDELNAVADLGLIDSDKIRDLGNVAERGINNALRPTRELFNSSKAQGVNDFFWKHVGRMGSISENMFKVQTYRDVLDVVKKNKYPEASAAFKKYKQTDILNKELGTFKAVDRESVAAAKSAMRESANRVNATFFDYGDISAVERHVMKRFFPYWTFLSKNFKMWTDVFSERPEFAAFAAKMVNSMGEDLTPEQRAGLPQYIKDLGGRVSMEESDGEKLVIKTIGSFPMMEALKNLTSPAQAAIGGATPIIKSVAEVVTGVDSFTGRASIPNENEPVVRVQEQMATLLSDDFLDSMGIVRDQDGKLKTAGGAAAALGRLVPGIPLLDDLARASRDVGVDDEKDLLSEYGNRQLNPVRSAEFEVPQVNSRALKRAKKAQKREAFSSNTELLRERIRRNRLRRKRRL